MELPLYKIFESLRKNGFNLGIKEYFDFLKILNLGDGINKEGFLDRNKLLILCKILWFKPNHSKFVFESIFNENFQQVVQEAAVENPLSDEDKIQEPKQEEKKKKEDNLNKTNESSSKEINPNSVKIKYTFQLSPGGNNQIPTANLGKRKFLFTDFFFDLSKRQIQQSFRFLPVYQPSRFSEEIDIDATVQKFAKEAIITLPVYKKDKTVTNKVYVFIDNGGSMVAFESLVSSVFNQLFLAFNPKKSSGINPVEKYYFYNVPEKYCYKNISHTEFVKMDDLLAKIKKDSSYLIIFSDAGAARGGNSDDRFRSTLRFLIHLKKSTNKIIWLNPIPPYKEDQDNIGSDNRWGSTTAKRISRFVPMYHLLDHHELQAAVNKLKGKS